MVQEVQRKTSDRADLMRPLVVLDGGNRFINGFKADGTPWVIPAVVR
jgi:hypothetical protein